MRSIHIEELVSLERSEQDGERRSYIYTDHAKYHGKKVSKGKGGHWYMSTKEKSSEERTKRCGI